MTDHTTRQSPQEIPYGYCHCGCGQKTKICTHTDKRFGHVKGEPLPYLNPGHKKSKNTPPLPERLWQRIDRKGPNDCWNWLLSVDGSGYGCIFVGSKIDGSGRVVKAHRLSYELHNGPIPDNMYVLHHCDNPRCVNPNHLFLGTLSDNTQDMYRKGRADTTTRQRGQDTPNAKLTNKQVLEIRAKYIPGKGVRELMVEYGVSKSTIERIVTRKSWKHI